MVKVLTDLAARNEAPGSARREAPDGKIAGFGAEIVKLNGDQPIPHWTIHDIRPGVATQLAGLKIAPHVIEAVLNHKSGQIRGVAAIYNRYECEPEKRQALDAWAFRLGAILKPVVASNVVRLTATKI